MSNDHNIKAMSRDTQGNKGASRRLRTAGFIPAIVYGGHADPKPVQFAHNPIWLISQHEWFYSSILTMDLDGASEKVLLRDMQRHPFKAQIMHMDFLRVSENEAIRVKLPLHFLNQEVSPAGKIKGVVITHEINEIEVSCLPKDLPEYLEVDLGAMEVGDIIHLSAIKLPAGVEIPELKLGHEHDHALAIAKYVQEEVEVAPLVEGEVPVEPTEVKDAKDADEKK